MRDITVDQVKQALRQCIEIIAACQDRLTEVDSATGDGDLGVSMVKGSAAMRDTLESEQPEAIGALLTRCATAFNRAAPSTMGTLVSMSLMALGMTWKDKSTLSEAELVSAPRIMADAIARFGKAQRGNKTILDALYPFADALEQAYASSGDFASAYREAVQAARDGLEATRGMKATVGRARWLGERASESVDGGALFCVCIVEGLSA